MGVEKTGPAIVTGGLDHFDPLESISAHIVRMSY